MRPHQRPEMLHRLCRWMLRSTQHSMCRDLRKATRHDLPGLCLDCAWTVPEIRIFGLGFYFLQLDGFQGWQPPSVFIIISPESKFAGFLPLCFGPAAWAFRLSGDCGEATHPKVAGEVVIWRKENLRNTDWFGRLGLAISNHVPL